jgi:hypothetical protein
VCKEWTEAPTDALVRQVHPGLRFSRDYETLRPYGPFCDETITLADLQRVQGE